MRPKTDMNRKPRIEGNSVIIDSNIKEEMDKQTFLDIFEERANKIYKLKEQRSNLLSQLRVLKDKVPNDMSDEERQRLEKLKEDMEKVDSLKKIDNSKETLQKIDLELENLEKDYDSFKETRDQIQEG